MKYILEESDIQHGLFLFCKITGYRMVIQTKNMNGYSLVALSSGLADYFNTTGELEMFLNGNNIKPVVNLVTLQDIM